MRYLTVAKRVAAALNGSSAVESKEPVFGITVIDTADTLTVLLKYDMDTLRRRSGLINEDVEDYLDTHDIDSSAFSDRQRRYWD
jgi:hypothetical protein